MPLLSNNSEFILVIITVPVHLDLYYEHNTSIVLNINLKFEHVPMKLLLTN